MNTILFFLRKLKIVSIRIDENINASSTSRTDKTESGACCGWGVCGTVVNCPCLVEPLLGPCQTKSQPAQVPEPNISDPRIQRWLLTHSYVNTSACQTSSLNVLKERPFSSFTCYGRERKHKNFSATLLNSYDSCYQHQKYLLQTLKCCNTFTLISLIIWDFFIYFLLADRP